MTKLNRDRTYMTPEWRIIANSLIDSVLSG